VARSRLIIPAGFFLALAGGGLAVSMSAFGPRTDIGALVLSVDTAPDRRPGDANAPGNVPNRGDSPTMANPIHGLRSLRFAILRAQSPPHPLAL
jgi:hypothetical protein